MFIVLRPSCYQATGRAAELSSLPSTGASLQTANARGTSQTGPRSGDDHAKPTTYRQTRKALDAIHPLSALRSLTGFDWAMRGARHRHRFRRVWHGHRPLRPTGGVWGRVDRMRRVRI